MGYRLAVHLPIVLASLFGAAVVLLWRVRETTRPATARSILIPPLGMSTGFSMFILPQTRVPPAMGIGAFLLGALCLSYPLIHTSRLVRQGETILLQRSKAFLWILLGLLTLRIVLRAYVERFMSPMQTAALFFLLAFGMLLPWRVVMYLRYRALRSGRDTVGTVPA